MEFKTMWPKQKSCNSCVKAKRRCDRVLPTCSRCNEKSIICLYGTFDIPQATVEDLYINDYLPGFDDIETLDTSYGEGISTIPYPLDTEIWQAPGPREWTMHDGIEDYQDRPGTPVTIDVSVASEGMSSFCNNIYPWHAHDPTTTLYHTLQFIKSFATSMALFNTTPFSHQYLYRDDVPPTILTCFATCVLYINRTAGNTSIVLRTLDQNVCGLLRTTAIDVETVRMKLAKVQALLIYETIRLFDGDVSLRSMAEKDLPLLKAWTDDLCLNRNNLSEVATDSAWQQEPANWKDWILAESVRRTIFMVYSVMSFYELMKTPGNKELKSSPWDRVHRWTLSRSMWEATKQSDFEQSLMERSFHIISDYAMVSFLEEGRVEELDDFARMIFITYVGVDKATELIAAKKDHKKT